MYTSPLQWTSFHSIPSCSSVKHEREILPLTCDVAVHLEGPQWPAAIGVNVEETSRVPLMPVHLTGLLIKGWKDTKTAEMNLCLALHITLERSVPPTYIDFQCWFFPLYSLHYSRPPGPNKPVSQYWQSWTSIHPSISLSEQLRDYFLQKVSPSPLCGPSPCPSSVPTRCTELGSSYTVLSSPVVTEDGRGGAVFCCVPVPGAKPHSQEDFKTVWLVNEYIYSHISFYDYNNTILLLYKQSSAQDLRHRAGVQSSLVRVDLISTHEGPTVCQQHGCHMTTDPEWAHRSVTSSAHTFAAATKVFLHRERGRRRCLETGYSDQYADRRNF